MANQPSLLDDLGEEVTGIVAPVSLCMAVTVLLVRLLNPDGISSSNTVLIASIAYQEQDGDSSGKKLGGALLNALIFVGVVAGMTVLLFLLFKYKCYKFIFAYMGFAVFNIFFFITGALFVQVMQVINLHIDAFSLAYGLFNFSIVGTLGLLFVPIPLLAKQVYLIWVGIIVAYIFTFIPEWTAWVLLVLMALYDIAAVLIPGGPLKALVELAVERQQELPALIYEARPAGGRPYVRGWGRRGQGGEEGGDAGAPQAPMPRPGSASQPRPVAEAASPARSAGEAAASPPASMEMGRPASRPSRGNGGGSRLGPGPGRNGSGSAGESWASAGQAAAQLPGGQLSPGAAEDGLGTPMEPMGSQLLVVPQLAQPARIRPVSGRRPIGEGREDGEWQPLASQPQAAPRDAAANAPVLPPTSRARLGGGSGPGGPLQHADSSRSSYTSTEPLIGNRGGGGSSADQDLQGYEQAVAGTSDGRQAPTGPGAAVYGYSAGGPGGGKGAAAESGSMGHDGDEATVMGVRAVAPAINAAQIAAAVSARRQRTDSLRETGGTGQAGAGSSRLGAADDGLPQRVSFPGQHGDTHAATRDDDAEIDLPDSIKLGLGDFIFYSMLVGRAAMYDFMTVFSAYLAIIAGLGLTLLCLAVFQKALPALPFSIVLGVAFYFLTRLTLEPYIIPLASHYTYF